MNSATDQFVFTGEIRDKVDPRTRSIMDTFEKQLISLRSGIDQQSEHYSFSPFKDIRETHNNLIKAILASTGAKYVSLSLTIVESVNKHDFLTYALAARSTIEIVATFRYFMFNKIKPIVHEMASSSHYTAAQVEQLIIQENIYLRGTRFDWNEFFENGFRPLNERYAEWLIEKKKDKNAKKWIPGRSPPVEQTSVTTCLAKWAEDEAGVGTLYDLFCDLVHPNIGSVMSTMVHVGDQLRFRVRDPSSEGFHLFQKSFSAFHVLTSTELTNLIKMLLHLFLPLDAAKSEEGLN
jgi:hypothetical protein